MRLGEFSLLYPWCADHAFNLQCFGDPEVRKIYLDLIIADYEGVGGSTSEEDTEFRRDFWNLVRENIGLRYALYSVVRSRLSTVKQLIGKVARWPRITSP